MKKLLLILLCLPLLFISCVNNSQKEQKNEQNMTNSFSKNIVLSFNVTSKKSELTTKTGKDVSINEMITKSIKSGDKILFKSFYFTLDNTVEDALNFYSDNGSLMCNAPTKLSVMSMPPNGNGLTTYSKGDNIQISAMTLIKINSINFVISDIRFNE